MKDESAVSSFILHPSSFPKMGIVWQGNPRFSQPECRIADQRRSIPLAQFEAVARLPGVRLFSLQKGYGTEQLTERKAQWGMVDLGEELSDFMDTAAVMMNLDLIISVDTSRFILQEHWDYPCGPSTVRGMLALAAGP